MIQGGKRRVVCNGASYCGAVELYERRCSVGCAAGEECGAGASTACERCGAGRQLARTSSEDRRHGPSYARRRLVDETVRALLVEPDYPIPQRATFLARLVEAGPIPAVDGLLRWRVAAGLKLGATNTQAVPVLAWSNSPPARLVVPTLEVTRFAPAIISCEPSTGSPPSLPERFEAAKNLPSYPVRLRCRAGSRSR